MDVLDYTEAPTTGGIGSALAEAVYEFQRRAGGFLMNAGSIEEFDQRLAIAKDDIAAASAGLTVVDDPEVVLARVLRNAWLKRDEAEEERIARERKRAEREQAPAREIAADECPECGADLQGGQGRHYPGCPWVEEKDGMRKGAPFAGYDDFEDCVQQNSDKDDPQAYCGKIKHEVEGRIEAADEIELSESDAVAAYQELKKAMLPKRADNLGDAVVAAKDVAKLKATWTVGNETFEQPVEKDAKEQHEQFVMSTWPEAENLTYEEGGDE